MAMQAVVDERKCSGCTACVEICPVQAISMVKHKAVIDDKCVACGACVGVCNSHAIALE